MNVRSNRTLLMSASDIQFFRIIFSRIQDDTRYFFINAVTVALPVPSTQTERGTGMGIRNAIEVTDLNAFVTDRKKIF